MIQDSTCKEVAEFCIQFWSILSNDSHLKLSSNSRHGLNFAKGSETRESTIFYPRKERIDGHPVVICEILWKTLTSSATTTVQSGSENSLWLAWWLGWWCISDFRFSDAFAKADEIRANAVPQFSSSVSWRLRCCWTNFTWNWKLKSTY